MDPKQSWLLHEKQAPFRKSSCSRPRFLQGCWGCPVTGEGVCGASCVPRDPREVTTCGGSLLGRGTQTKCSVTISLRFMGTTVGAQGHSVPLE